ncbi:hypothetical protein HNR22_002202 [Micromonospora jinlongensis]|uniref:Uncharacterized protein n=1 Tax=Micromonospora jinlongensis TaxID=1287877 RepID=A0A7Z0BE31_9ACTN|nr:hypothetical protein [Micromonospora jinlongensis]
MSGVRRNDGTLVGAALAGAALAGGDDARRAGSTAVTQ